MLGSFTTLSCGGTVAADVIATGCVDNSCVQLKVRPLAQREPVTDPAEWDQWGAPPLILPCLHPAGAVVVVVVMVELRRPSRPSGLRILGCGPLHWPGSIS